MKPLMREGLRHEYSGMGDDKFFAAIDATGGWPLGYKFVGFEHSSERDAGFTNSSSNTGWWTVVASADDYYLWKLSPAALTRIADAAIERYIDGTRGFRPKAEFLNIKNWRGYKAATAKAEEKS